MPGQRADHAQQLADVGASLLAAAERRPRRLEARALHGQLEEGVGRVGARSPAQFGERPGGVRAARALLSGDPRGRIGQRRRQRAPSLAERQQRVVGEGEEGRSQHATERDLVLRLSQPAQQMSAVEDFLPREEARAARRVAGVPCASSAC